MARDKPRLPSQLHHPATATVVAQEWLRTYARESGVACVESYRSFVNEAHHLPQAAVADGAGRADSAGFG